MCADDRVVALLARAREGDEAAFRALYERDRDVVLRFAERRNPARFARASKWKTGTS
jgi:hypothetical protein